MTRWLDARVGLLAAAGAWLAGVPALAQLQPQPAPVSGPPVSLSMPAAVRAAVQWHPSVSTSTQQVLQAGEGIAVARSGYYPQVRAGIGTQLSSRDIAPYDSRRLNQASVSVSQMLYDFGKVSSAVGQAEAAVAATQAQVLVSVDDVARDTALTWIEVHRQQALRGIALDQIRGVQGLADLVTERERLGASSRSDVVQAQSRVEAARAQQLTADAQLARWRANLMSQTGARAPVDIAGDSPGALMGACPASLGTLSPNPPAVQLAAAQRSIAEATVKFAQAQRLPTLSVDGAVNQGLDSRSRLPGEKAVSTTVGFNFSAPLYEGGGNQARERAAVFALSAADATLAQAQLVATQSLQDAQTQSQGQAQRLPVLAARTQSIRATRDLYQQQYLQLGTRSLLDLLNSEQEYHAVRFEQVESAHELQRLGVLCLYHTGQLRTAFALDDLQAASATLATPVGVSTGDASAPSEGAHSTAVSSMSPLAPRPLGLLNPANASRPAGDMGPTSAGEPRSSDTSKPLALRVARRLAGPASEPTPVLAATGGTPPTPTAGRQP
ncbi:MAG: type I secretion protein TolC [Comamonadaceae bacterium]|nr:MAG: type I secretion protein TolC [Comamonadaceae bacterium]